MGIESDQLVYDYLSRVGDLAQQRHLPSGTRRELVAGLRDEIDRQRARATGDSPAAVRRILGRIGTPDEVVTAAGTTPAAPSAGATPTAPPAE
ncbi:HAAS signaling domain-containing protein, partial [Streptomyces clavuligerus]|uniref:HAAS signaling domain-containing protein n=1 Tax=Streptomyces clavuligerus TaxID=1901 RepID=UPI0040402E66